MPVNSVPRVCLAIVAASSILAPLPASAQTPTPCHGQDDRAQNFRLVQAPGSLVPGVPARVVVAADNPGPNAWRGEGNSPHPYRLGVGGDPDPAGEVVWSAFDCGGYSNDLKDQRVYICPAPGQQVAEVGPGGTAQFGFSITAPTGSPAQVAFRVRMVFDAGQECDGWFEVQHTALFPVEQPTLLPDLMVDGIDFSTPPTGGQSTNATARLRNGGQAASGPFNVRWLVDGVQVATGGHDSLDAGQTSSGNVHFAWTPPTSGVHTLRFEADYDAHVAETNDGNNGAEATFDFGSGPRPDLLAQAIELSTTPVGGQPTTAHAVLRNAGQAASGPFNVRWLVDGAQVAAGGHVSLDPGQTSTGNVNFTWTPPATGVHTLRFEADYDLHVTETEEGNNGVEVTVDLGGGQQLADLVVDGIDFTPAPQVGQTTHVTAHLRNAGGTASGSFAVRWSIDGNEAATSSSGSLDPGQTGTATFDWSPSADGVHTVVAEADSLGQVPESNESNNSRQVTISVGGAPQPELRIEVVDNTGAIVASGTTLTLNSEGWPTPNGLTVRVILTCPAGGALGCRGFPLKIVESAQPSAARFYMEGLSAAACAIDGPETVSPTFFSYEKLTWRCHDGASPGMELAPGETRVLTFALMAQPSDQGNLDLAATWRDASGSHALSVPRASIHPVIVIPGILGTMPPSPIIGQLDPVLGVYTPLVAQLQKMGYVDGETLMQMPYDWRRSNHESAGVLKDSLVSVLSRVASLPEVDQDGKVDLIVHSMGGLVTRTYVQNQGVDAAGNPIPYGHEIRKVIFSATPHRGFPEDYRSYEGVTWEMYLYDDDVAKFAMENVFWPFFVEKRWRKRHFAFVDYLPYPQGHPFADRVMCLFGPLDCTGLFSPTLKYRMMHDAVGGTDSMREMLPTEDADLFWPYLCPSGAGGVCGVPHYPFGRQVNPLLDGPTFLNATVLDLAKNLDPVPGRLDPVEGAKNIYVIHGKDPVRPIDQTDVFYVVDPPFSLLGTKFFQNGTPVQNFVSNEGDDLIPSYSMNLKLLLPQIPAANVVTLSGGNARHKEIMSQPAYQGTHVPRMLAGLAPLPFTTPYLKPPFLLNPAQWWSLAALCPVNLTITDPQGRRLGFDPATGGTFHEIPNAFYAAPNSADGQFLVMSDPLPGTYQITATGFDADSFSLMLSQVTRAGVFRRWTTGGHTVNGQSDSFTVQIDTTLPAAQHPPVANAGPDETVNAGPDCNAAVTLDASLSHDEDGEDLTYVWVGPFGATAGPRVTVNLPVGVHTITLLVQDGQHTNTSDTLKVTVVDRTPPVIRKIEAEPDVIPAHEHAMREVEVEVDASEGCGGAVTCRITSVTADEEIETSDWKITGPLTVKLRAERDPRGDGRTYRIAVECRDAAGNAASKKVKVLVPPPGRMKGEGRLETGHKRFDYDLDVREDADGDDRGELEVWIRKLDDDDHHGDHDGDDDDDDDDDDDHGENRFEATSFEEISFSDDDDIDPGQPRAVVDTVSMSGNGKWNGRSGYTFEAKATDAGEPGPGRDRFRITIRDSHGKVVAKADGKIVKGNNQAR
jgi:hypothetical protein